MITTNNRVRPFDYDTDGREFVSAYGRRWYSDETDLAHDSLKALGYDGAILDSTNAGTCGVVFRYWDREGYELDGVVVGWYYSG